MSAVPEKGSILVPVGEFSPRKYGGEVPPGGEPPVRTWVERALAACGRLTEDRQFYSRAYDSISHKLKLNLKPKPNGGK